MKEGDRMRLKKAAVIGFTSLALGVSPAAADSINDGSTVALTMGGGGGLMAIGCMAIALLTRDDEVEEEGFDRRGIYIGLSGSYARQNFSDSAVLKRVAGDLQGGLRAYRATATEILPRTSPPTYEDPGYSTFSFGDIDDDAFGILGRGGYRCHPYVSAELQFEALADFDGSLSENGTPPVDDSARGYELELESLVFTTNAKGHLLTGRYQPFVLLGLGFMRMESKARDITGGTLEGRAPQASDRTVKFAARYGAGLDVYLTQNIVVTAEGSYLMPTGQLDDLDYYQFGVGLQYRF
jgi:opacity protein-like surface antigen